MTEPVSFWEHIRGIYEGSVFIYGMTMLLTYALLAILSFISIRRFQKRDSYSDYKKILGSPLAPGISVIAPAFNEGVTIIQNVRSLLTLNYPRFEVIIVNDGSTDDTLEKLIGEFEMVQVDFAYNEKIKSKPVRRIFKSSNRAYDKLVIVDKVNGKSKADASNAGINVSSFNYFLCTDVDCIIEKDTLLKMIEPFMNEEGHRIMEVGEPCPECGYVHVVEENRRVIATGATLRIVNSCEVEEGVIVRMRPPKALIPRFQEMEYIRSYVLGKLGWSMINCVPNVSGGLGLFDKEIAIKAGGYDPLSFGEDMDLVTRMCAYMIDNKQKYAIRYIPSTQCWTEGPPNMKVFNRQRTRWGRGLIQIMTLHKKIIFNPKYGKLGLVVFPYNLLFEFLAPIVEVTGIAYYIYIVATGRINWQYALILLLFVYLYSVMITTFAILWDQLTYRYYKTWGEVLGLALMAFLEPLIYHPFIVFFSLKGYLNFITGRKHVWGNMQRQGFGKAKAVLSVVLLAASMTLFAGSRAFGQKAPVSEKVSQVDPSKMDPDQLTALAKSEMAAGHYRYALTLTHMAIRKNSRDVDLRFLLGKLYQLNNYPDSAEEVMKDILYQNPKYRDAYPALAAIELGRHNEEEALCFIDDGLYYYPADKEFALKKFAILQTMQRPTQADAQGNLLLDQYGQDTSVLRTYINYKIESAQRYTKLKDYARALYEYRQVLSLEPTNKEALEGAYNTQLKGGNYEDALSGVNSGLNDRPDDYDGLFRKLSLLEDLHRYPEAIEVLQHILKIYPSDVKARQLDVDLRLEAGRYFMSEDPYLQFQSVLEKSPSNREALDYVINLASARGLNGDALVFVNKGLHYYPTDKELLSKKISILESLQKYTEASDIAETLWRSSGKAAAYQDQYIGLKEASGRYYMNQLQYDSALADFSKVLEISPAEPAALNYSINILAALKNYDGAVALLDKALKYYPASEGLLLKKAGILEDDTRYPEALALLAQLMNSYPENGHYKSSYVDLSLTLGRQMMQAQDYDTAYGTFSSILRLQPDNAEALGTLINIELTRGIGDPASLDSALVTANQALTYYPSSRDFLLKKASVLEALKRYPEAYALTGDLMNRYRYNTKIRDQYTDELLASGRLYNSQGQTDSALREFGRVLEVKPRDSAALAYSINILNTKGKYDSALALIDRGLRYYPGNEYFTLKRAVVLENLGRFTEALPAADSVAKMDPTHDHEDYADYLRSRTFRNAIGLSYLSSHFDSLESANIATLHYTRYTRNGSSFDTKLNFAGRSTGTGLQLEEEIYYTHNKTWSSYGDFALANEAVFPRVRLAYSLFRNFSGGWEGELGVRYLNLDSISVTSAVGSIAKYFGDFYVNARGYLIFAPGKMYEAGILTARQYLDNKTDYLFGTIGVGDSPDEFSRNFQLASELGSQTYSIGAGYQKAFSYRNILNLSGTWYNQKLAVGRYRNQYDLSLSFLRKF